MAQTISATAASRVNRRFLLLAIILGLLAAVLIYAQLSSSSSSSVAVGDVPVVVAKVAIPAGTSITANMVEVRQVPSSVVGADALSASAQAIGQVARYPISVDEQLFPSKLVAIRATSGAALSYVLEAGQRGMAINVQQVTDAGGLVLPGDHVDVIWLPLKGAPAFVLLSNVEVTAVSQTIVDVAPAAPGLATTPSAPETAAQRARTSDAAPHPDAITVTVMVPPDQAGNLLCAESFASNFGGVLRLAVRSFGDTAAVAPNAPACPPIDLLKQINSRLTQ